MMERGSTGWGVIFFRAGGGSVKRVWDIVHVIEIDRESEYYPRHNVTRTNAYDDRFSTINALQVGVTFDR